MLAAFYQVLVTFMAGRASKLATTLDTHLLICSDCARGPMAYEAAPSKASLDVTPQSTNRLHKKTTHDLGHRPGEWNDAER